MTVEGEQDRAILLQNKIKRNVEDVHVRTRKLGMTTIFLLGVDLTTTEGDGKRILAREIQG